MAVIRHLALLYECWITHKEYLLVFTTVQNLIGIDSFDSMQVLIFYEFGFKMPIYVPFRVVWVIYEHGKHYA